MKKHVSHSRLLLLYGWFLVSIGSLFFAINDNTSGAVHAGVGMLAITGSVVQRQIERAKAAEAQLKEMTDLRNVAKSESPANRADE